MTELGCGRPLMQGWERFRIEVQRSSDAIRRKKLWWKRSHIWIFS
jgi:hypothetical protein